jgi:hypothetical protein
VVPDLDSSPEVLTWMWMLRGVSCRLEWDVSRADRPASSWVAFLIESTEETQKRLGTDDARGLHLSLKF